MIEEVSISQKSEILTVLTEAFKTNSLLPSNTPSQKIESILRKTIDYFGKSQNSCFYGIRKDNKLVCIAFLIDSAHKLNSIKTFCFFMRLFHLLGWSVTLEFLNFISNRPEYKDRYLDLVLFGTLPAYQKKGLGKEMLDFLFTKIKETDHKGIILGVAKNSPAYNLYLKEGFFTDKEISNKHFSTGSWMKKEAKNL